jgi:hypothetical protein
MAEERERETNNQCLEEPGFPKLLFACMDRVGIYERPEYSSREYEDRGTLWCEMIIFIGRRRSFLDIDPFNVTATGYRLQDTYQVAAWKTLHYLCQIYEKHIDRTPMMFFLTVKKNHLVWLAQMKTLEGRGQREDDPTMLHMSAYLLTLDDHYDKHHAKLRQQIRRAEDAKVMVRRLQVRLATAEARAVAAQSNEAAAIEDLKEAEERHSQELKDAHLVGPARRRMCAFEDEEPLILNGIPVIHGSSKRKCPDAPPAPPPTEGAGGSSKAVEPPPKQDDMMALLMPLEDHPMEGEDSPCELDVPSRVAPQEVKWPRVLSYAPKN